MRRLFSCCLLSGFSLLSACSLFSQKTPVDLEKPNALQAIQASAQFKSNWSMNTGMQQLNDAVNLQPYLNGSHIIVAGQHQLAAFDVNAGRSIWRTTIQDKVTAGVNGGENRIYIGTASGHGMALDANNGKVLWKAAFDSEILGVSNSRNGLVAFLGSNNSLYAVASQTGQLRWKKEHGNSGFSLRGASHPVLQDQLIAGLNQGILVAYKPSDGQSLWAKNLAAADENAPKKAAGTLQDIDGHIAASTSGVFANNLNGYFLGVEPTQGNMAWGIPFSSSTGATLLPDWSALLATDAKGRLWNINPKNGQVIWQNESLKYRKLSRPVVLGQQVLVSDFQGYVHAFNLSNGQATARIKTIQTGTAPQLVTQGKRVFVFSRQGQLTAYQLQ